MNSSSKKFVIVDGNAIIHKSFHAVPPFRSSSGELVNAVYGFTNTLFTILDREQPNYIAMTFDKKGPTFRHELAKSYKATRVKAPDELYEQIPRIRQIVEAFGIPIFEKAGFEADDLIGTLAQVAKKLGGLQTVIVTGDMDTTQLVDETTVISAFHNSAGKVAYYDIDAVKKRYGITPEQMVDYKALVGDSSDNISGVPGVGPKTAVELLSKYKSLIGIYEHVNEITGAVHTKLVNNKELAFLSQNLARIVCDVPVEFDLKACVSHEFPVETVRALFTELGFRSLLRRLDAWEMGRVSAGVGKSGMDGVEGVRVERERAEGLARASHGSVAVAHKKKVVDDQMLLF